jgi:hypothetical protein
MKIKPFTTFLAVAYCTTHLVAAPLPSPAAVHVQPDSAAPVLMTLPAGTEPFTAEGVTTPAGWLAVTLPGSHDVFLRGTDQLKDLSPKPGTHYLLSDKPPEIVVAIAEKGDLAEITGIQGRFIKYRLSKPLIGYIPAPATPPVSLVVVATTPPLTFEPVAPAPVVIAPKPSPRDLVAPPAANRFEPPPATSELPRLFQGVLVSTYSPLRPRRPYAFQLNDRNGERYAYLDVSRLPPGVSPDTFAGLMVVIYGVAQSVAGQTDMVIAAESLQTAP